MKLIYLCSTLLGCMLFSGCDNSSGNYELSNSNSKTYLVNKQNGELFYVDNKTMYKVVTETNTENKIGEILSQNMTLEYTQVKMKTKIYNDSIYYTIELFYVPKFVDVIDENDKTKKTKKDVSEISFDEWKKTITSYDKNYHITLVFKDKDDFTVISKEVPLKYISVNNLMGVLYEGSYIIDKSYTTKINTLTNYYYLPESLNDYKRNR